jgi:hypothetical protein
VKVIADFATRYERAVNAAFIASIQIKVKLS